jgi:hypothetical protein
MMPWTPERAPEAGRLWWVGSRCRPVAGWARPERRGLEAPGWGPLARRCLLRRGAEGPFSCVWSLGRSLAHFPFLAPECQPLHSVLCAPWHDCNGSILAGGGPAWGPASLHCLHCRRRLRPDTPYSRQRVGDSSGREGGCILRRNSHQLLCSDAGARCFVCTKRCLDAPRGRPVLCPAQPAGLSCTIICLGEHLREECSCMHVVSCLHRVVSVSLGVLV